MSNISISRPVMLTSYTAVHQYVVNGSALLLNKTLALISDKSPLFVKSSR